MQQIFSLRSDTAIAPDTEVTVTTKPVVLAGETLRPVTVRMAIGVLERFKLLELHVDDELMLLAVDAVAAHDLVEGSVITPTDLRAGSHFSVKVRNVSSEPAVFACTVWGERIQQAPVAAASADSSGDELFSDSGDFANPPWPR